MKPCNLISVYQGNVALESLETSVSKKYIKLKSHEIRNLHSFCDEMIQQGCNISDFNGYFVGYSIDQIGKEFDLLRFGEDILVNIEIKSEFEDRNKIQKILKQMNLNYYYLKFLNRPIRIYTFVENDGYYEYKSEYNSIMKVEPSVIAKCIREQIVDYSINPNNEFVPSNYLISPFNYTDRFINGEYFLTSAQQRIENEIKAELKINPFMYFCISANAGTGKTLLMYDIAKKIIETGKSISIIHCGKLNEGHKELRTKYGWNIYPIKNVSNRTINMYINNCAILFIDESQRIREYQLKVIINKSIENKVPVLFSYDIKQYLRGSEGRDVAQYIRGNYPEIRLSLKKLTTKIRMNKEMASFINNLFNIGSSKDHMNYDCVTIEFINNMIDLKSYVEFLHESGWIALTYTVSQYNEDPYDKLADISDKTAHDVIGQEFSKVVFVMDENFKYSDTGRLMVRDSYYSAKGMLYQIVTRVVGELKIIVYQNPTLYLKLLEIKSMGSN